MEYSPGFVCPTVFNPELGNRQRGKKNQCLKSLEQRKKSSRGEEDF